MAERKQLTQAAQQAIELATQYKELFTFVTRSAYPPEMEPEAVARRLDGSTDGDFRRTQIEGLRQSVTALRRVSQELQSNQRQR